MYLIYKFPKSPIKQSKSPNVLILFKTFITVSLSLGSYFMKKITFDILI